MQGELLLNTGNGKTLVCTLNCKPAERLIRNINIRQDVRSEEFLDTSAVPFGGAFLGGCIIRKIFSATNTFHGLTSRIDTFPMQSLHATSKSPKRSLESTFQFRVTMSKSQPSGISPSKKANRVLDLYGSSRSGRVKLTGVARSEARYSLS